MSGKMIGIDLGTTSSRVSVLIDGYPVIIENQEGDGTTPSHVSISSSGVILVGKPARRHLISKIPQLNEAKQQDEAQQLQPPPKV